MSKFTCLVLCVVAVSLSGVHATAEEKAAFIEAVKPYVQECSKEHGVTPEDIKSAKAAGNADGINSCFLSCVYKKAEVITEKGEYDVDKALEKLKKFVSNEDDYAKFANIGKKCASVNEKSVSDGEAGCERAALLTSCFLEHKSEKSGQPSMNPVEQQRSGPRVLARLLEAAHGLEQARASVQRLSLLRDLSPFSNHDRP
ncbi:uncharacterized protein LOC111356886 isoform X1 [Spodoptera litura]|uniref:Uncharacterized protein LOC111356886 isoform X1 n=1 Tax=Spodoptera litura TaxID=69820 RepID=A0A9J7ITZ8_SPOLT|nr:uncharacterized protein LOC111356886 isoform X1 [Spodoptera litura]